MDELDAEGEFIALVISDHVMPGKTGVELLTDISQDPRFTQTKKKYCLPVRRLIRIRLQQLTELGSRVIMKSLGKPMLC